METDASVEQCRLCANFYVNSTGIDFVHLFKPIDSLDSQIAFIHAILESWQLQILPDDGLPQRLCANCFTKFCNINTLREECIDAQTRLLDAILTQNMTNQTLCINDENTGGLHSFFAEELLEMQNAHMGIENNESLMQTSELEPMQLLDNLTNLLDSDITNQVDNETTTTTTTTQNMSDNLSNIQTTIINTVPKPITNHNNNHNNMDNMDNFDLEDLLLGNVIHKKQNNGHDNQNQNGIHNNDDSYESLSDEFDDEEEIVGRVMTNPLACQYCHCPAAGSTDHLIFKDCEALSQHFFDIHDPKRPYNCSKCDRTYQTMRKREDHVRIYHKENDVINNKMDSVNTEDSNVVQCIYCFDKVRGSLELHELNCSYVGDWKCSECNDEFKKTSLKIFRKHERIHDSNKQLFCRLCNRTFRRPSSLATHEQIHFSKKYNCELCNEGFNSEYLLKRHKYSVHDGDMPVHCNICNKGFASFSFFQRHQNQYHPENQQANICTNCNTKFNSPLEVSNHLAKPKDKNGKCVDSMLSTSSPPSKRLRSKNNLNTYSCEYCEKHFPTKDQLQKHVITHNTQELPLQCEQCEVRFCNANELQEHINVTHLQEFDYKCDICGESFNCEKLLNDHSITHSGKFNKLILEHESQ